VRIGWPERAFAILNAVFPALIDKGLQNNRMTGEEILAANRDVASPTLSLSNIPSNHVDERKQA
jgi:hypothetical protein